MKIEMRCKNCNELAPIDEERSTENWIAYKNKCSKCGGDTCLSLKGGENGEEE